MDNIHFISTLGIAIAGGYFSFFRPQLLSPNIKKLETNRFKWLWAAGIGIVLVLSNFYLLQQKSIPLTTYYIFCWLLFIGAVDAYSGVIPNRLLYLGIAGWLFMLFTSGQSFESIIPAVACGLLLAGLRLAGKKIWDAPGFGWGDIKLFGVLGLLMGWDIFLVFYIAILSGGIFSAVGILLKKLDSSSKLSFAPHIAVGFLSIEAYHIHDIMLSLIL